MKTSEREADVRGWHIPDFYSFAERIYRHRINKRNSCF